MGVGRLKPERREGLFPKILSDLACKGEKELGPAFSLCVPGGMGVNQTSAELVMDRPIACLLEFGGVVSIRSSSTCV